MPPRSSLHSWPHGSGVAATLAAAMLAGAAVGCSSSPSTEAVIGGGLAGGGTRDGAPPEDAAVREGASPQDAGASTKDAASGTPDAGETSDGSGAATPEGGGAEPDSGPTADEQAWLAPQNAARAAVGEAPLAWDPIAAEVAQSYASSCPMFDHNANRSTQYDALGGTGGLGENIAAGAPTQTVAGAVASWVNEEQYYDHATNTCASGQECGHYTQIVWKSTTGVGCAKYSCTSTTNSPFGTFANGQWDFSVCDYSPPGNYVGESPY